MRIEICGEDIPVDIDGIPGTTSKKIVVQMPNNLSAEQITKIKNDGQILSALFDESGDKINQALQSIHSKDPESARALLNEIGMTEQAFAEKGGGAALAIAVAIGLLLYSQSAY